MKIRIQINKLIRLTFNVIAFSESCNALSQLPILKKQFALFANKSVFSGSNFNAFEKSIIAFGKSS